MKSSFIDSKFYLLLSIITSLFMLNQMFILFSFPFFLTLIFVPLLIENSLFYFFVSLFLGPAFVAMIASTIRLINTKSYHGIVSFTKDYVKNFKLSALFSFVITSILYILFIDSLYFISKGFISLAVVLALVMVILTLIYFNGLAIITRYHIRLLDLFKTSFVLLFYDFKRTIMSLVIIMIPIAVGIVLPKQSILFSFGIFSFYLSRNYIPLLEKTESLRGEV